jgi:NADH:ubiquinone oxidoreductase subunit H
VWHKHFSGQSKHPIQVDVSPQVFVFVVAFCAAAIALWFDRRLEARTPRTVTWTLVHLGGSLVALQVMPQLVALVVADTQDPLRKVAATLFVLLPVLTYAWLSALWLLRLLQRSAQLRL